MVDREQLRQPLHATSLRDELVGAGTRWRRLDVVDQTGSTNADLLARAASNIDIDRVVLIAEHQTAGRGRHGRHWTAAPRAQITMSVGVRIDHVPTGVWGWLSLATGLAVADTVAPLIDNIVEAGLKWPNDVLAGPAGATGKLAGILVEVTHPYAVIGIGLNVTQAPEEVDGPGATSLLDLGVPAPDRNPLVRRLLSELAARIAQWQSTDPRLAADYRARSLTIGARVCVQLPGGKELAGIARDIDHHGRLCLDVNGRTVLVSAGDVVHLR
ncbi:biotin--[acetyl-CoA-carboxylase] ligase [Mycobacterium simiae]|uniref:biotin--[biotin carboxyl-carrier protein] ligase n=1 Tax=Mycobacterium simiae TaxID=1784 RepID=A0A5B1BAS0_MYCSI|nr:biotin--[acetyl-CoA-carboxylase] ligase [Mycobacterium simiae]KAA1245526.1 biotin--[acetyl-CoA-carboxylase] ligase [Mycobacterium simiae]